MSVKRHDIWPACLLGIWHPDMWDVGFGIIVNIFGISELLSAHPKTYSYPHTCNTCMVRDTTRRQTEIASVKAYLLSVLAE